MKTISETKRLILREFSLNDAEDLFNLNSDDEVIKYTGDQPFSSINEAHNFISDYNEYEQHGFGRWAVILKSTNKFIGWCGLKLNEENMVDLGFRFFKNNWNQGFASEAAVSCLKYGFTELKLKTIIGRSLKKNVSSIKVLEKIGMTFWKETLCHGNEECVYYRIERQILNNN